MTANADQIDYWNETAGAKWVENQQRLDRLMAPLGGALIEGAAPRPGEHVLDVGCGCGDVSLQVAGLVGAKGSVTAVDVSRPMLAHAEARRLALPPADRADIAWHEADAMVHAFDARFDLMVSRFGVMFFDDRPRAFANLRTALRSGGRFAFLTWRRRRDVEWMQTPLEWLAPILPIPEEIPGEIGPFALADAEITTRLLEHAGFAEVDVRPVDHVLTIGEGRSNEDAVEDSLALLSKAGPASRALRDIDGAVRDRALDLMREGLRGHVHDSRVVMSGACWLYMGRA